MDQMLACHESICFILFLILLCVCLKSLGPNIMTSIPRSRIQDCIPSILSCHVFQTFFFLCNCAYQVSAPKRTSRMWTLYHVPFRRGTKEILPLRAGRLVTILYSFLICV